MSDEAGAELSLRAQILENQRLINHLNEQLARKHKEVRVIQQISSEITSTLDLDNILQLILNAMDEVLGFKHSMILLADATEPKLSVVSSRGFPDGGIGAEVAVGQGIIGMVAKRKRIMRMGNIRSQLAYTAAVRQRMEALGQDEQVSKAVPLPGLPDLDSQIAIPLLARDRLIGVLSVESSQPNAFDQLDEMLLMILGNQAASAIDNARLYRDERLRLAELHTANARLAELNEGLEAIVSSRMAELSAALRQVEAEQVRSRALLERMVPHQVIPLLLSDQLVARRLNATVLFTDLEGFTKYSSALEPDEVFSQLNYFFSEVGEQIEVFRGYVNKTNGDSIMALFGVPSESPTHAIDAVLAGLRIQSDLERHQNLHMRVGINTGVLTAGMLGPADKSMYDVLGDAVNVASRMEKLCRPGGVTITEATHRLIEPYFEILPLGEQEVKGKGATLAFEVTGLRPLRSDLRRFDPTSLFAERYLGLFTEVEQIRDHHFDAVDFLSVQARDGTLLHNEAAATFGLAFLRYLRSGHGESGNLNSCQSELDEIIEADIVHFLLLHDLGKYRVEPEVLNNPALSKEDRLRLIETLRIETAGAMGKLDVGPLVSRLNDFSAFQATRGAVPGASLFTVIAAVADLYDTLTAPAVYKARPWSITGALEEISRMPYALQETSPLIAYFIELMRPSEKQIKPASKSNKIFR